MARTNWSRAELVIAFNLYCKTPFGHIHNRNPEIISLAKLLGRTPSAVSWKLANFARLDPALKKRRIAGATHGSKAEVEVWEEFSRDWAALSFESEQLLSHLTGHSIEAYGPSEAEFIRKGLEREQWVRARVNQAFFRATVLASYDYACCITGLTVRGLLNASHIIPWAVESSSRVDPRNGLCLNALHDRAFDKGLITITTDYRLKLSPRLETYSNDAAIRRFFLSHKNSHIRLPKRFLPMREFLEFHNREIFVEA